MNKPVLILITLFTFFLSFARGNDCGTAQTIVPQTALNGPQVAGSFASETFSGEAECTGPGGEADVWYKFQAMSATMFVRAQTAIPDMDLILEVKSSCGGAALACVNNAGNGGSETASLSGLTPGSTYYFRVYRAAASAGNDFTVAVSYIPTVQLLTEYCGLDDYTTNVFIKSSQPQNTNAVAYYQWRFQELDPPFNVYEIVSPETPYLPNLRLKYFEEIQYGRSYDVSVRLVVNPGAVAGVYGPACTIKLQDEVLSTQVEEQYNQAIFNFCDFIGCDAVGGADRYRWTFFDLQNTISVYGPNYQRLLRLYQVPGLKLGQTYIVTVYAEVNGMVSPAGVSRFISTNNYVPNTGLRTDLYPCGGTYPINSQVQAVEICRAQTYTWRFRNTSQGQPDLIYTRTDGSRFLRLEWVTGLIPGDSYDVDVKARQGQKNGDYSAVCNITIGASTNGFNGGMAGFMSDDEALSLAPGESLPANPESAIELVVVQNGQSAGSGLTLDISTAEVAANVRLELFDLSGKKLADRLEFADREGEIIHWQIPGLTSGIYILRASNGDHVISKKVTVF